MSLATAAEYVLMLTAPDPEPSAPVTGLEALSPRERELVTLVAQGHTDAQIASQGTMARTMRPATPTTSVGHGRIHGAFHRIRLTIRDMNYASRRVVERQAPWTVDKQWHRK